jgi:hypothetical protein
MYRQHMILEIEMFMKLVKWERIYPFQMLCSDTRVRSSIYTRQDLAKIEKYQLKVQTRADKVIQIYRVIKQQSECISRTEYGKKYQSIFN